MSPNETNANPIISAVEKFYKLNDDIDAPLGVLRKMFFEFLRTNPTLSTEEIDTFSSVAVLMADLVKAQRVKNKNAA